MEDAAKPPCDSIYSQGFVRVAIATPRVEVAPKFNTSQMLQLAGQAASADAVLVVFPEVGISAYSNEDLFFQDAHSMRSKPDSIATEKEGDIVEIPRNEAARG
jgi:NAD+ synthase (glutamine-hydrolysing)